MTTKSVNFKVEENLKVGFDKVANDMGLTTSALLNIFIKRVVDEQQLPFTLKATKSKLSFNDFDDESKQIMQKVSQNQAQFKQINNLKDYKKEILG